MGTSSKHLLEGFKISTHCIRNTKLYPKCTGLAECFCPTIHRKLVISLYSRLISISYLFKEYFSLYLYIFITFFFPFWFCYQRHVVQYLTGFVLNSFIPNRRSLIQLLFSRHLSQCAVYVHVIGQLLVFFFSRNSEFCS